MHYYNYDFKLLDSRLANITTGAQRFNMYRFLKDGEDCDRLGHEDIETTLGTYGHLYPNMNKEVATKLTNLITAENGRNKRKKLVSNQCLDRKKYKV